MRNGFSSGRFVWLRGLCTIYAVFPELWRELLNIHSDVSPAIPRVGIPNEKPHEITYYCLLFKKLAQDFFISETDLVTIEWVIVRSSHFLKTCLFLEMQSLTQTSVFLVCTVNYSLFFCIVHYGFCLNLVALPTVKLGPLPNIYSTFCYL